MNPHRLELLRTRRFSPWCMRQSFGACDDNPFKDAIIFLAAFGTGLAQGGDPKGLVAVAGGLFILP